MALVAALVVLLGSAAFAASQLLKPDATSTTPVDSARATPSVTPTRVSPSPTPTSPSPTPASASPSPSASEVPGDFAQIFSKVRSGVVRIDSSTCDGGGIGTGFLIDDALIVTAAHVVEGAASLGLTFGDESDPTVASGVVVGIDRETDMALIRADRDLDGHVFGLADSQPDVGQSVVAIGFPQGEPMTLTSGIVSGLNRTISFEGRTFQGLIQTDAAINPGNSGGPMLDLKGAVQGVADAVRTDAQGIAYAIPAATVRRLTEQWRGNTKSVVDADCEAPTAPDRTSDFDIVPPSDDPLAVEVTQLFRDYFTAINGADYDQAWALMSPRLRPSDVTTFADSLSSTIDFGVVVHSVKPGKDGSATAHVYFVSTQASEQGPEGQTCTVWDLDYTLVPTGDPWQIRRAKAHGGGSAYHSC
ncbi:hypothetical protein ASG74_14735 [Knoellia sp. Soil729]|nr:hypothetical protein ASG74_14735 [Knoellia sp. Soil729]